MQRQGPRMGSVLSRLGPASKIAVVRLGRMGDLVIATPALRALWSAAPRAEITLLVSTRQVSFARRLPWVDAVVPVPQPPDLAGDYRGDPAVQEFFTAMRSRRFDLAIQLTGGGDSTNDLTKALGARLTAGQRSAEAPELDIWMPFQRPFQSEIARLMDVMGLVGVPSGDLRPEVPVLPEDATELRQVPLDHAALARGEYIGVHVGSRSGARRWPAERFAAVLDTLLHETDLKALVLGRAEEAEVTRAVLASMRHPQRVVDLAGKLTLGALIALLPQLYLYMGNDSGPAHLATALDVPAVIIYGNAHPGTFAPLPRLLRKENIIGGVAVEGRVEVDEIDRLIRDIAPQDVEVVPVVQDVPACHPGPFFSR